MTIELFIWVLLGVTVGIIVGALPGLTGAMAIALTLPLTFAMEADAALALLVAMYVGSVSGGLVTATLLRMPGTPASIMTTLDAYPMAAGGQPRRALGLGIIASFIGGVFAWGVLVGLAQPVASLALKMHPLDLFALVMIALALVSAISCGDMVRGLFAAFLGMALAMPGINPASGELRWTFGFHQLADGLKLLPVLIGLFAISQAIRMIAVNDKDTTLLASSGGSLPRLAEWIKLVPNIVRSSAIGSFIGVLPGIGANIASLLAYGSSKALSKQPEQFGKGCDEGVVASESANNASVGGALVPLVALGIPGSVIDAILLGAFVIHGLQPGPLLFENNPETVTTISNAYLLANVLMVVVMLGALRWLPLLMRMSKSILLPAVLVFCVVGSYALANRIFDVWVMLAFGALGLLLEKYRIPLAPLVLGFVLAPLAEENLVIGLMMSGEGLTSLFTRPVSAVLLIVAFVILVVPVLRRRGR